VLINRMFELAGNLTFARNLLAHLATPGGRVVIVTGGATLTGTPSRALDGEVGIEGQLRRLNTLLVGLSDYTVKEGPWLRVLAVALALAAAVLALRAMPARRAPGLEGDWVRIPLPEPEPSTAELFAGLDRGDRGASYAIPAGLVRDAVNRRLAAALAIDDPLGALAPEALARLVADRLGPGAAASLAAFVALARALPGPLEGPAWGRAPVARREFDRLADAGDRLCRSLESVARATPPARD
jgi:hypothetical protein